MMNTRTPTQIKELKNTNLNIEFSFLTRDYPQITTTNSSESATKPSTIHHKSKTINPSTTHTNPSEQTTPPKSNLKKKTQLVQPPFLSDLRTKPITKLQSVNESHHQTPICAITETHHQTSISTTKTHHQTSIQPPAITDPSTERSSNPSPIHPRTDPSSNHSHQPELQSMPLPKPTT